MEISMFVIFFHREGEFFEACPKRFVDEGESVLKESWCFIVAVVLGYEPRTSGGITYYIFYITFIHEHCACPERCTISLIIPLVNLPLPGRFWDQYASRRRNR